MKVFPEIKLTLLTKKAASLAQQYERKHWDYVTKIQVTYAST